LLLVLAESPERCDARLAWSSFRRHHQARAKRCHAARRTRPQPLATADPPVQTRFAGALELTDGRWARIAPLLPPQHPRTGRPNHDHRTILGGILWVMRTGSAWRDLPVHFGPWETVHSRYTRWRKAGIWPRILDALDQEVDPVGT
jgi:hypothetical protein